MNTSFCKGLSVVQGQELIQKWHIHEQVCLPQAGHKDTCGCGETGLPTVPQSTGLDSRRESSPKLHMYSNRLSAFLVSGLSSHLLVNGDKMTPSEW